MKVITWTLNQKEKKTKKKKVPTGLDIHHSELE